MSQRDGSVRRLLAQVGLFAAIAVGIGLAAFPSVAQDDGDSETTTTTESETTTTESETTTTTESETTTTTESETTTTTESETTTTTAKSDTTTTESDTSTTTESSEEETTTTTDPDTPAPTSGSADTIPPAEGTGDNAPTGTVSKGLAGALSVWNERVREKEAELEAAEKLQGQAEAALSTTDTEIDLAKEELVRLDAEITQRAIEAFIEPDSGGYDLLFDDRPSTSLRMRTVLGLYVDRDFDGAEQLRIASEDLEIKQAQANRAQHIADEATVKIEAELAALEEARDKKASLTAQVAKNLGVVTKADIVLVRGFEVHYKIEENVRAMIDTAAADGINLGGGGYRSFESQVRIRKANCGTSHYAIWEMPSRHCSPPTARPGASQHELGLALDLTCDGALIRSANKCFLWLKENAEFFGFKNLPSERWHWSTTGR